MMYTKGKHINKKLDRNVKGNTEIVFSRLKQYMKYAVTIQSGLWVMIGLVILKKWNNMTM